MKKKKIFCRSWLYTKFFLIPSVFCALFFLSHSALALDEEYCQRLYQGTCAQNVPPGDGWLKQIGRCIKAADPTTTYYCYTMPMPVAQCSSQGGTCKALTDCPGDSGVAYVGYCESNTSNVCCVSNGNGGPGNGNNGGGNGNGGPGNGAGTGGGGSSTSEFPNPLNYNTFQDVFVGILNALRNFIAILAVVFIVIGALLYITSGGNEKQVTAAKSAITAAMIGLAIGIAAPTFLKEIATVIGWKNPPADVANATGLYAILTNLLNFLLGIVGVLAIIMLVIGAFMYLTAAGDEKRIDTGKDIVKWSIFGIVIALSALVIVRQIASFFT